MDGFWKHAAVSRQRCRHRRRSQRSGSHRRHAGGSRQGIPRRPDASWPMTARRDATPRLAAELGAEVVRRTPRDGRGKGGAMTAAARAALASRPSPASVVLCDGDLGASAGALASSPSAVESGDCDLAVAAFARREGGGFGIAVGFARRAIRSLTGLELTRRSPGRGRCAESSSSACFRSLPDSGWRSAMTIDAVSSRRQHQGDGARPRAPRHRSDGVGLPSPRPPARRFHPCIHIASASP